MRLCPAPPQIPFPIRAGSANLCWFYRTCQVQQTEKKKKINSGSWTGRKQSWGGCRIVMKGFKLQGIILLITMFVTWGTRWVICRKWQDDVDWGWSYCVQRDQLSPHHGGERDPQLGLCVCACVPVFSTDTQIKCQYVRCPDNYSINSHHGD